MPNTTKKCILCEKNGAYSFNRLCSFHWDQKINENIKKFVEAEKAKRNL